jgi:hypothetical protein
MSHLASSLTEKRAEVEPRLGAIVGELSKAATEVDSPSIKSDVEKAARRLGIDKFQLLVAGRFKNGKSTLLNVLIGRLTRDAPELRQGGGPLPMDDLPCTATLSRVRYSEVPYVKAWMFREDGGLIDVVSDNDTGQPAAGRSEMWTFERYRTDASITRETEANEDLFRTIQEFEIGLPAELTQAGVVLIDSPGTSEDPRRDEITRRAASESDAAIAVFRSDGLAGLDEQAFLAQLSLVNDQVFKVVNLFNGRSLDARLRAETMRRLAKSSPDPAAENPEAHDIYFVDARMALEASLSGDTAAYAASGMERFENRVSQFLLGGKYLAKLKSARKKLDVSADLILRQIEAEELASKLERDDLNKRVQECRRDLGLIADRRANVNRTIDRAGRQAEERALSSYRQMINDLILSIEEEFARHPIKTMSDLKGQLKSALFTRQAVEEGIEILRSIITRKFHVWAENDDTGPGLQKDLRNVMDDLLTDLERDMRDIGRLLSDIQLRFRPATIGVTAAAEIVSLSDRLASAGLGFILLGPAGLAAAQGGWRALAGGTIGGVATAIGASLVTAFFGVTFAPALIVGAIMASILGGSIFGSVFDLEKRIREKALEAVRPALSDLRSNNEVEADLSSRVRDSIVNLKMRVNDTVNEVIGQEEDRLRKIEQMALFDMNGKSQRLSQLQEARTRTKSAKVDLANLIAKAEDLLQ